MGKSRKWRSHIASSNTTNTWVELIILINFALITAAAARFTSGISIYFGLFLMFPTLLFCTKRMLQFDDLEEDLCSHFAVRLASRVFQSFYQSKALTKSSFTWFSEQSRECTRAFCEQKRRESEEKTLRAMQEG